MKKIFLGMFILLFGIMISVFIAEIGLEIRKFEWFMIGMEIGMVGTGFIAIGLCEEDKK
jgi:hypothetical protein